MKRRMYITIVIAMVALMIPSRVVRAQEVPPGPTVVYRTSMEITSPLPAFDVVSLVLDFAPGAWTPIHTHGGPGIVSVIDGEVVHQPASRPERRVPAGDSFVESPGNPHRAGNTGHTTARVVFVDLLPKEAELTTNVPGPDGQAPPPCPS